MENEIKEQPISTPQAEMICENCHKKVNLQAGRNWKIYYGYEIGHAQTTSTNLGTKRLVTTTHKYEIAGSESVFVCHECDLARTISHHRTNEITFYVIGVMTLCLLIGIVFIFLGIREHNILIELRTAMQKNDQKKMIEISSKVDYRILAKELVVKRLRDAGHSYTAFFTEGQYAKLITEKV